MHFLSNFRCKITFMCSVNFWQQEDSNSLFKGSIGHLTSKCKWPISITDVLMAISFLFFFLSVTISNNGWAHEEVLPFSPKKYSKIILRIS